MAAEHDPYDVVPDGFCEAWGADTIPEALRLAELAESTTDASERRRCPRCGSKQVDTKQVARDIPHQKSGRFKCMKHGCRHHFSEPADENTIFVTDERAEPFDWLDADQLKDARERTGLPSRRVEGSEHVNYRPRQALGRGGD